MKIGKIHEGHLYKGYTNSPTDYHDQLIKNKKFAIGDQKLRLAIVIKKFKNDYCLVLFLTNNTSSDRIISFNFKQKTYKTNLMSCYIIPVRNLKFYTGFIQNDEFKRIKKASLDFVESREKRKNVYDNFNTGAYDLKSEQEIHEILLSDQFNNNEMYHRYLPTSIALRISILFNRINELKAKNTQLRKKIRKQ